MSKYIYWVKKKTCLGVLERGDRDKDNETGLKEGGGIEMSTILDRGNRDKDNKSGLKEGGGNRNVNYSAPFACRSFA